MAKSKSLRFGPLPASPPPFVFVMEIFCFLFPPFFFYSNNGIPNTLSMQSIKKDSLGYDLRLFQNR